MPLPGSPAEDARAGNGDGTRAASQARSCRMREWPTALPANRCWAASAISSACSGVAGMRLRVRMRPTPRDALRREGLRRRWGAPVVVVVGNSAGSPTGTAASPLAATSSAGLVKQCPMGPKCAGGAACARPERRRQRPRRPKTLKGRRKVAVLRRQPRTAGLSREEQAGAAARQWAPQRREKWSASAWEHRASGNVNLGCDELAPPVSFTGSAHVGRDAARVNCVSSISTSQSHVSCGVGGVELLPHCATLSLQPSPHHLKLMGLHPVMPPSMASVYARTQTSHE